MEGKNYKVSFLETLSAYNTAVSRISEIQISASRHYDLRKELLELLSTESEKDILAVLFDKYARAIINSITVVSAVELKIKWLDDSVTEIRREF